MANFTNPPNSPNEKNKKSIFKLIKKDLVYLISGPVPLFGVFLSATFIFGIPLFSSWKANPINDIPFSGILKANIETKRFNKISWLLKKRLTSAPAFLPNNPLGGINSYGIPVTPRPEFTKAEAIALVNKEMPSLEIQTEIHKAKINGRVYDLYLFDFDGQKYWHPYGNVVQYNNGKRDRIKIYEYAEKNFSDFSDRILPRGFGIELDHAVPESFASAMDIPREQGTAVFSPAFANAPRTNNIELVDDFSNFDWRLSPEELPLSEEGGLSKLIETRLRQSLKRNLDLYYYQTEYATKLKTNNPDINLNIYEAIYSQIEDGYNAAYSHDMEYYNVGFCNRYHMAPDKKETLFAFYNELLLAGSQRDLEKAKIYSIDYFTNLNKDQLKIKPEFFIAQMSKTFLKQYELSQQIQFFIHSKKYKEHSQQILDVQFRSYQNVILDTIKNFQKSPKYPINEKIAQELLRGFKEQIKNKINIMSELDLFIKIFKNEDENSILLGNFYKKSSGTGQLLNLTITNAKVEPAIIPNESNIFKTYRSSNRNSNFKLFEERNKTPYAKSQLKSQLKKELMNEDENSAVFRFSKGAPSTNNTDDEKDQGQAGERGDVGPDDDKANPDDSQKNTDGNREFLDKKSVSNAASKAVNNRNPQYPLRPKPSFFMNNKTSTQNKEKIIPKSSNFLENLIKECLHKLNLF